MFLNKALAAAITVNGLCSNSRIARSGPHRLSPKSHNKCSTQATNACRITRNIWPLRKPRHDGLCTTRKHIADLKQSHSLNLSTLHMISDVGRSMTDY